MTESPVRSWLHFTSVLQLGERLADPEAGAMFFRGWYPWIPWIPWMEHSTNCNLRMPPVGLGLICACPIPRFQGFSKCILRVPLGFDPLSRFIHVYPSTLNLNQLATFPGHDMISMLHPRREVVALTIRLVIFVEDGQLFHERFLAAFPVQVRSSCEAILLGTATVDFRYWENLLWIV